MKNKASLSGGVHWLMRKYIARQEKRMAEQQADTINNLARLYELKERGALSKEEYAELKARLLVHIQ